MPDFEFTMPKTDAMVEPEEYLNCLITERCNEIYYKIIQPNPEYQNLQTRFESCFQELLQQLPEPNPPASVTEKLWTIIGEMEMLLPRLTYRQAFKDGVRLKKWAGENQESSYSKTP